LHEYAFALLSAQYVTMLHLLTARQKDGDCATIGEHCG
jgi:hypothetical protein